MFKQFPFFKQRDAMDCGPTCLRMVAAFHGKNYTLPYLRAESHISREGVSMEGICNAAEQIGFRAMGVKIPFSVLGVADEENVSLMGAPLPCIVHWQQKHFVVVKKVTPQYRDDSRDARTQIARLGAQTPHGLGIYSSQIVPHQSKIA